MKIKRYTAMSMRAALAQVRAEQGPDAVILSSRRSDEGIEVIAAVDYDEGLFAEATRQRTSAAAPPAPAAADTRSAAAAVSRGPAPAPERTHASTTVREPAAAATHVHTSAAPYTATTAAAHTSATAR